MKISTATIGFRAPFQLHRHAFLTPWVEKNSAITCSKKNRDYSSGSGSGPVRYIPKKSYQDKKSNSSSSETMKVPIRKDSFEFSEAGPLLDSKVQYPGNFVRRRFDFDSENQCSSRMRNMNSDHDGVEQDDAIEDSEDFSEGDKMMKELEELSVHHERNNHSYRNAFQPAENKNKITTEKLREDIFSTSRDENAKQKSFSFEAKPQYRDTIMEECEDVFEDDDNLEERDDEPDEEVTEKTSIPRKNRYGKQYVLKPGGNNKKHDAEKAAVKLLATRAFTTVELKKKLCGKGHSTTLVEAVISDFQSRGLLNDSWFAEAFCQSRWSSSTWGPRRIKQELSRKGVSKVDTENAIDLVFRDEESESSHGLSKTSMDTLFTQASKQWLRGRDVPKETRKSRIIRWLLYRGFSWDVIGSIVKRLESSHLP